MRRVLIGVMAATRVARAAPADPPMTRVPCVTFSDPYASAQDTTLVSDGQSYAVCWRTGACHDGSSATARPATPALDAVATRVEPTRICTGDRCAPLGPRARAAVAQGDPSALHATTDRAILVIGDGDLATVWSRAADRVVVLPAARRGEGEIAAIDVLGERVLVSRWPVFDDGPPPPWASGRGVILDARGAITGRLATSVTSAIAQTRILPLADDAQVVFDGAGGFALIARGAPVAFGALADWAAQPAGGTPAGDPALRVLHTDEVPVQAIALPADPGGATSDITGRPDGHYRAQAFAYEWCSALEPAGCRVGEIQIVFRTGRRGERSYGLRRPTEHLFPVCQP